MTTSRSRLLTVSALALPVLLAVACSESHEISARNEEVGRGTDRASAEESHDGDAAPEGPRSVDTSGFDRSCTVDSECVLVTPIDDCSTPCCDWEAVRGSAEVSAAFAAVRCGTLWTCAKECTVPVATCVSGTCEAVTPDGG